MEICIRSSAPLAPLWHYVVVRDDLPAGFLVAQAVHAAGESSPGNLPEGTNAVVLGVPDEAALAALARRFELAGVAHVAIREPDAPYNGQLCALGLVPVADRAPLRALLSSLPLYGRTPRCLDCVDAGGLCYTHNGGLKADRLVGRLMEKRMK